MPGPPASLSLSFSEKKLSQKKKKSSLDYSRLAQKLIEASGVGRPSKLAAGLYIVATPIGHMGDITLRALMVLADVDYIACEDTRHSGALLAKYGIKNKKLLSYHDHNADDRRPEIIHHIARGCSVALISDAGMPLIADPGYKLVRDCQQAAYGVVVLPGANAALTALAGSGLPTDHFFFAGFLPPKNVARRKVLASLQNVQATLVFYEAPQRLLGSLQDMVQTLGGGRRAAIGRELTKLFEETKCGTLEQLCAFYSAAKIKGEIVVMIAPPDDEAAPSYDLDALLKEHLRTLSLRDAVAAVCGLTHSKKSAVYARALRLAGKEGG